MSSAAQIRNMLGMSLLQSSMEVEATPTVPTIADFENNLAQTKMPFISSVSTQTDKEIDRAQNSLILDDFINLNCITDKRDNFGFNWIENEIAENEDTSSNDENNNNNQKNVRKFAKDIINNNNNHENIVVCKRISRLTAENIEKNNINNASNEGMIKRTRFAGIKVATDNLKSIKNNIKTISLLTPGGSTCTPGVTGDIFSSCLSDCEDNRSMIANCGPNARQNTQKLLFLAPSSIGTLNNGVKSVSASPAVTLGRNLDELDLGCDLDSVQLSFMDNDAATTVMDAKTDILTDNDDNDDNDNDDEATTVKDCNDSGNSSSSSSSDGDDDDDEILVLDDIKTGFTTNSENEMIKQDSKLLFLKKERLQVPNVYGHGAVSLNSVVLTSHNNAYVDNNENGEAGSSQSESESESESTHCISLNSVNSKSIRTVEVIDLRENKSIVINRNIDDDSDNENNENGSENGELTRQDAVRVSQTAPPASADAAMEGKNVSSPLKTGSSNNKRPQINNNLSKHQRTNTNYAAINGSNHTFVKKTNKNIKFHTKPKAKAKPKTPKAGALGATAARKEKRNKNIQARSKTPKISKIEKQQNYHENGARMERKIFHIDSYNIHDLTSVDPTTLTRSNGVINRQSSVASDTAVVVIANGNGNENENGTMRSQSAQPPIELIDTHLNNAKMPNGNKGASTSPRLSVPLKGSSNTTLISKAMATQKKIYYNRNSGKGKHMRMGSVGNVNHSKEYIEKDLMSSLDKITLKFDPLFPFYRMSDKDCKHLTLMVYEALDNINKIFCVSKARYLEAIIYYKDSLVPERLVFFNYDDSWKEVSTWTDIQMSEKYCLRELGFAPNDRRKTF